MSFGFSVGDFVATAQLITDIVGSLRTVGGAASEFQELERELFGLKRALDEIEHLKLPPAQQPAADAIKCAALNCQYVLEEFAGKLKKYDNGLGCRMKSGKLGAVTRKIQWALSMDKEIQMLRVYIAAHVGSLNMRLLTLGLTSTSILTHETKTFQSSQGKSTALSHDTALEIRTNQEAQKTILQGTKSLLAKLCDLVSGDVVPQIRSLCDIANRVWKSNLQIYNILINWETQLPCPDLRHTWLQPPVRLEDPLRRCIVIPSEYSFGMMQAVILEKFKAGPGSTSIRSGDYEIANAKNHTQLVMADTFTGLIPGMNLRMAIILCQLQSLADQGTKEHCPNPGCGSQSCEDAEGGGRICCVCGIWFARESGKRKRIKEDESGQVETETLAPQVSYRRPIKKRKRDCRQRDVESIREQLELFKNIRFRTSESMEMFYSLYRHLPLTIQSVFRPLLDAKHHIIKMIAWARGDIDQGELQDPEDFEFIPDQLQLVYRAFNEICLEPFDADPMDDLLQTPIPASLPEAAYYLAELRDITVRFLERSKVLLPQFGNHSAAKFLDDEAAELRKSRLPAKDSRVQDNESIILPREIDPINCICGNLEDDDDNNVLCETCETWQHIDCYYPIGDFPDIHCCIDCKRRSERKLEGRVESTHRASEIHKRGTGRSQRGTARPPRATEQDVMNEEMYEQEDDDLPRQYRRLTTHLQTGSVDFNRRLAAYLTNQVAIRSAIDQIVTQSYAKQYPVAPQYTHNRPSSLPLPLTPLFRLPPME